MQDKVKCIICDIDGTVALMKGRRTPFEYLKAFKDEPNQPVIDVLLATHTYYATKYKTQIDIIFTSARENVVFEDSQFKDIAELTVAWVAKHISIPSEFTRFIFRKAGDYRKDAFVKFEVGKDIMKDYDVLCVFDDRDQVVDMWRNGLSLQCFQVASGNF